MDLRAEHPGLQNSLFQYQHAHGTLDLHSAFVTEEGGAFSFRISDASGQLELPVLCHDVREFLEPLRFLALQKSRPAPAHQFLLDRQRHAVDVLLNRQLVGEFVSASARWCVVSRQLVITLQYANGQPEKQVRKEFMSHLPNPYRQQLTEFSLDPRTGRGFVLLQLQN